MTEQHDTILDKKVTRRGFVGWLIRAGFLATLAGMAAPILEYLWPVTSQGPGQGIQEVAKLDDIPVGGSKKVILAGSAILLIRTAAGVKALSAICTHLGCLVDWDGLKKEIVCPCHAGIFDLEGKPVAGPPPRPLPSYSVKISDGRIFVKV